MIRRRGARRVLGPVVVIALLAGLVTIVAPSAGAAPAVLPPVCSGPAWPGGVVCDPSIPTAPAATGGVARLYPRQDEGLVGLVGSDTWFGYFGFVTLDGGGGSNLYLCVYSISGVVILPGGCPFFGPAFSFPFSLDILVSLPIGPFQGGWWAGFLPTGLDVDFGSPDETGTAIQNTRYDWVLPQLAIHQYEQKGLHDVEYRVYWRPWTIVFALIQGIPGWPLGFPVILTIPVGNQIVASSVGQMPDPYEVSEIRGTLDR